MATNEPNFEFRDKALAPIWEKVRSRKRLSEADGMALIQTHDVTTLGLMANWETERRHGKNAYFVTNRQCNPTNVCVLNCKFCEFARRKGEDGAWEMDREEILAHGEGVHEVHIVGGLHPDWRFDKYLAIVKDFRERFPKLGIKAWTAVEIEWFARLERRSITDILKDLRAAGLDALPGGGAEVFSERVRKELFFPKIGWKEWRAVHLAAHQLGIKTNATLLYGHIETYAERVDHMLKLRQLEDEAPGFMAFIPLAFSQGETGIPVNRQGAVEDVRTIATARLLLDNFDHIKAYWVLLSPDLASLALNFGASDLDGTIGREKIMHMAGNQSPEGLAKEAMRRLIREAGKTPVERDIFYRPAEEMVPA
ncbi:MAG TPA: aminofutalosine synthase MqnE [bacterium]|jgi:aminodeoxyfutalosine synthase|nr:aminofutalosine synthase MqnE [bacterium]